MKTSLRLCALTAAAAIVLPATANAAPTTVTLRIEGPSSTLFEGPVTTDVATFAFPDDNPSSKLDERTPVRCDAVGDSATTPSPTFGAALVASGVPLGGTYFDFGTGPSPFVSRVGDITAPTDFSAYFAAYQKGLSGKFGICGTAVAAGDDLLLAYGTGSEPLLKLNDVPAQLAPGATATAKVTDAAGKPVAGAAVDGRSTAADGTVQIGPFTATGPRILKAEKPGAIRSNGGQVCVTSGSDGACGTVKPIAAQAIAAQVVQSATTGSTGCVSFGDDGRCGTLDDMPPLVHLTSITSKTYTRAQAPRELKGQAGNFRNGTTFLADPSGIKDIKLRITRYSGSKCWTFDGKAEAFKRLSGCGTGKGTFFSIGAKADWSYLLPAKLAAGKYRVEAFAVDGRGNSDKVRRWNRNHVVFQVK
jgi:hypothetical protein